MHKHDILGDNGVLGLNYSRHSPSDRDGGEQLTKPSETTHELLIQFFVHLNRNHRWISLKFTGGREVASRERVFLEQSGDHGRVEVRAYAHDHTVLEIHDPAVTVIEPHTVLGRGQ